MIKRLLAWLFGPADPPVVMMDYDMFDGIVMIDDEEGDMLNHLIQGKYTIVTDGKGITIFGGLEKGEYRFADYPICDPVTLEWNQAAIDSLIAVYDPT